MSGIIWFAANTTDISWEEENDYLSSNEKGNSTELERLW
jgi:hypothetical protein